MQSAVLAICLLLASFAAWAQAIRIGHLETADDIGINWLFFHCNQMGQTLNCTVFQTLIFTDKNSSKWSGINDYSEIAFTWNQATQSWISRESPVGPCGRITIGTLEHDPSAKQFWRYTEKKITTKPEGVTPNGFSCKQLPDMTLNYTW